LDGLHTYFLSTPALRWQAVKESAVVRTVTGPGNANACRVAELVLIASLLKALAEQSRDLS
jgi:hypothetical protein